MEANFTADVVGAARPYAAFASTILDVDTFHVLDNVAVRYLGLRAVATIGESPRSPAPMPGIGAGAPRRTTEDRLDSTEDR
jgi:hypothetical protein